MQCEVCGRHIMGTPYKAIIEGARLIVCNDCALLGSMSWEIKTNERFRLSSKPKKSLRNKPKTATKRQSPLEPALELVKDFGTRIRQARESRGLSHEDLGRKINEKISQLKKLEGHKMVPNHKLAKKLEYALKIKLLVPISKDNVPKNLLAPSQSKAVTLGDLVKNKER